MIDGSGGNCCHVPGLNAFSWIPVNAEPSPATVAWRTAAVSTDTAKGPPVVDVDTNKAPAALDE
jgi:hypothetical protein